LAAPAAVFIALRATPAALVRLTALGTRAPFATGRWHRLARRRRGKLRRRWLGQGTLLLKLFLQLPLLLSLLHRFLLAQLAFLNGQLLSLLLLSLLHRVLLSQLPFLDGLLLAQLLLLHGLLLAQRVLALKLPLLRPPLLVQPLRLHLLIALNPLLLHLLIAAGAFLLQKLQLLHLLPALLVISTRRIPTPFSFLPDLRRPPLQLLPAPPRVITRPAPGASIP
jgi:hypothetical protein